MFHQYFEFGGPLMWPLLFCSVLLGAFLFERLLVVAIGFRVCGLKLAPRTLLWHRRVIPFFTDIPPSLGLLGTVVGIVQSFQLTDGMIDGKAVGAGLGVACLTTIVGLVISISASVIGHVLEWLVGREGAREGAPSPT